VKLKNNSLVIFGGYDHAIPAILDDMWIYDINLNSWTFLMNYSMTIAAGNDQPVNKYGFDMVMLKNGTIVLFGGLSSINAYGNDLWFYDPDLNLWSYISGNKNQILNDTLNVAIYDIYPGGRRSYSMNVLDDDSIILIGGQGQNDSSITQRNIDDIWKYNPTTNVWSFLYGSKQLDANGDPGYINYQCAVTINSNDTLVFGGFNSLEQLGTNMIYKLNLFSCISNCSGHGVCIGVNPDQCNCYSGYTNYDCSSFTCNSLNNCIPISVIIIVIASILVGLVIIFLIVFFAIPSFRKVICPCIPVKEEIIEMKK